MLGWIDKNIIEKIDLPILLISFLILCYFLSADSKEGFKEGFDIGGWFRDVGDKIKSAAEKLVNEINSAMNEFVEKLKQISPERIGQELRKPFDQAGDLFKKGMNDAKGGFDKIGNSISGPFTDFASRLRRVGDGINDIFLGMGDEFIGLGSGLRLGFTDIGLLLEYTGEYFITNMLCGLRTLVYLPFCAIFYLIDLIGEILYLPIRIILYLISVNFYKRIYDVEDYFWKQLHAIDNLYFYKNFGYYLLHWPKNIRDTCYNCKRLKSQVLTRKAHDIDTDFNVKMPVYLGGGVNRMKYGGDEILSAFR